MFWGPENELGTLLSSAVTRGLRLGGGQNPQIFRPSAGLVRIFHFPVVNNWGGGQISGPEIWGGDSDSTARWRQLTCRFSFILLSRPSRWTEWALREHELEPHYTTRTEDIEVENGPGTDICGVRTCNSAWPHAWTTNEHICGNIYPLTYHFHAGGFRRVWSHHQSTPTASHPLDVW